MDRATNPTAPADRLFCAAAATEAEPADLPEELRRALPIAPTLALAFRAAPFNARLPHSSPPPDPACTPSAGRQLRGVGTTTRAEGRLGESAAAAPYNRGVRAWASRSPSP
jgi:hypothetical protein